MYVVDLNSYLSSFVKMVIFQFHILQCMSKNTFLSLSFIQLCFCSPSSSSIAIPAYFFSFMLLFKDIDQLKLIMLLVGTPGPELLMKISSESVSFHLCLSVTRLFPGVSLPVCCFRSSQPRFTQCFCSIDFLLFPPQSMNHCCLLGGWVI